MVNFPTPREYVGIALQSLAGSLGVSTDTLEGGNWDGFFGGLAQMLVRSDQITVASFDAQILDRAIADPDTSVLDGYCRARSGGIVARLGAVPSRGVLALQRPTTGAGAGTIYTGLQIRAPYNGNSYVFTVATDTPWPSGAYNLANVPVVAQSGGSASNVGVVTSGLALTGAGGALPIFDPTIVPYNAVGYGLRVGGGTDPETNSDLGERMRLYEQARRGATRAAVAFRALLAPGCKRVVTADCFDSTLGSYAAVYAGDINWSSLPAADNAVDPMLAAVAASIDGEAGRGFGCPVQVRGIASSYLTVTGIVTMARAISNYDLSALRLNASAQALKYFGARVSPYLFDVNMLANFVARISNEVDGVALTVTDSLGNPVTLVPSPLSPSQVEINGGLPGTLTRYASMASLINIDVQGPS